MKILCPLWQAERVKLIAGYVLGVVGVVMIVRAILPALANNLRYPAARLMMTNLLRMNPYQAEAIANGAKGTFYEAIAGAIKAGAMMMSRDPNVITKATLPSYDASAMAVNAKWKQLFMSSKLALGAVGGGIIISSLDRPPSILLIIVGGLVAIGVGFLWLRRAEVERTLILARAEVLPEVDRAFVDGRYVPRSPPAA